MKKRTALTYAVSIAIALAVGGLSALLTGNNMQQYGSYTLPPLAPPGWAFPVVWSILYVLMGVSAAMVYLRGDDCRRDAMRIYVVQLLLNLGWSVLFFTFQLLFASFVWLVVLEAVIVVMIAMFFAVRPLAGALQIPYFLWVAFAGYLNLSIFLLNGSPA